ncbi:putative beta-glucosidase K [Aspergillus keveii]|uniref:beta-glucosidase n=1 Tax=Aspergillus keveii TaxID=714993 RepID=A0ABR4FIF2_9EURO
MSQASESDRNGFDIEQILQNATIAEKVSLLSGHDFWHTTPLPRFNVPAIRLSDGPNGIRGTKFFNGVRAACLPCGTGLAATWDQELLYQAGLLIGEECKAKGAHCWLGPTVCIQRSPLGGRSFESLSEDPYVTGKLAAAYINGAQSTGVISTIKHFVANDQEQERISINAVISERSLREIHLLPFQIAIADANPGAVMACYNKVNGEHVSQSKEMLDGILRRDWGWQGLIMSDWFGTYSTSEALDAGLDLEMPGPSRLRGPLAELAVSSRHISRATIDERVRNVLEFVQRAQKTAVSAEESTRDLFEDRKLNRKLAADSVVLLKNESNILPLDRSSFQSIALIGPNMKTAAFCGGGSASLQPYYTVSPYQGIVEQLPDDVQVLYEPGAQAHAFLPELTASDTQTPEGSPGLRIRFYRDPPSVHNRRVIDEVILQESMWQLMGFSHPELDKLFYADIESTLVAPVSACFEFGLTVFGSANLYIDDKLVIDNTSVQRGGNFCFGKGTVEEKATVQFIEGTSYKLKVEFISGPSSKLVKPGVVNLGGGAGRLGMVQVVDPNLAIARAAEAAKRADVTVLCVGLTRDFESEGFDRPHMDLPVTLPPLINAVLAAAPNTILVTQSGSPFNMLPWAEQVKAHCHTWFGGNEVGHGLADVLFGAVNPSGKLPLSFPRRIEDTPTFLNFGSDRGHVTYGEGIYVGYRYYEKVRRDVLYPFGHGLSYSDFTFSDLEITSTSAILNVTNNGSNYGPPRAGAETVQMYISPVNPSIARPYKELKGFCKVHLEPGETRHVEIPFDRFTTAYWDQELHCWIGEKGQYKILVGSSSQRVLLEGVLEVHETTTWSGL